MAQVYSKRFFALIGLHSLTSATAHICPPGFVWVLRDFDCYYGGILSASVYLIGNQGQTIWYNGFAANGGGQYASWRGRQVLNAGDGFQLNATEPTDVTLSGYQLTTP